MKKSIPFIVFVAAIATLSFKSFRGDDAVVTVSPTVSAFDAVELDVPASATVTISNGVSPSIKLTGAAGDLDRIKTKVVGGRLAVYMERSRNCCNNIDEITVEITLPRFTGLEIGGSSTVNVRGAVAGDQFVLEISGSGSATFDKVDVGTFETHISGSGHTLVKEGRARKAKYEITGSGKIKAFDLRVGSTSAEISGSGKCEVNSSEELYADISGSGTITYKGNPVIHKDVSGSGSVRREY